MTNFLFWILNPDPVKAIKTLRDSIPILEQNNLLNFYIGIVLNVFLPILPARRTNRRSHDAIIFRFVIRAEIKLAIAMPCEIFVIRLARLNHFKSSLELVEQKKTNFSAELALARHEKIFPI